MTEFSNWKFKIAPKAEPYHSNENKLGISTYCPLPLLRDILATTEQMRIESLNDAPWRLGHARFKTGGLP